MTVPDTQSPPTSGPDPADRPGGRLRTHLTRAALAGLAVGAAKAIGYYTVGWLLRWLRNEL